MTCYCDGKYSVIFEGELKVRTRTVSLNPKRMKALFVFVMMQFAASGFAADIQENFAFGWGGRQFQCIVLREDVLSKPSWNATYPNPPLAPRRAADLAEQYATNLVAHVAFGLTKISLVHVTENKWIYEITFMPGLPDTYSGPFSPVTFVVFMDGTVAEYKEITTRPALTPTAP